VDRVFAVTTPTREIVNQGGVCVVTLGVGEYYYIHDDDDFCNQRIS
jgi:hypothetical protein